MEREKEKEIANELREKYKPRAIVLHGSRAIGKARPRSDWDVFLLFSGKIPKNMNREVVAGEDVEWKAVLLPVEDAHIQDTFGIQLQYARVLLEESGEGTELIARA